MVNGGLSLTCGHRHGLRTLAAAGIKGAGDEIAADYEASQLNFRDRSDVVPTVINDGVVDLTIRQPQRGDLSFFRTMPGLGNPMARLWITLLKKAG